MVPRFGYAEIKDADWQVRSVRPARNSPREPKHTGARRGPQWGIGRIVLLPRFRWTHGSTGRIASSGDRRVALKRHSRFRAAGSATSSMTGETVDGVEADDVGQLAVKQGDHVAPRAEGPCLDVHAVFPRQFSDRWPGMKLQSCSSRLSLPRVGVVRFRFVWLTLGRYRERQTRATPTAFLASNRSCAQSLSACQHTPH